MRKELWDYLGQLNEIAMGASIPDKDRLAKPPAVTRVEQSQALGLPYLAGGLYDQPYLLMQEYAVVINTRKEFQAVQDMLNKQYESFQKGKR